ncbi:MAG TPA: hypothetical protein VNA57_10685 [Acidimicrobiales bacterium]|nr:hypothetical protein [Acidimicrobiales bacterium]
MADRVNRLALANWPRWAQPPRYPSYGPHVRLGLAWAAATMLATIAGAVALALVMAPVAALAAAQAARSWRRRRRRAAAPVSAGGAGLMVIAAIFGLPAVAIVAVLVAGLLVVPRLIGARSRGQADSVLTGGIALAWGLAGAAPVLLRGDGFIPVFVLLSLVHVYDASAYVVGTGADGPWEGPAAGVVSIAAVTLAVAAVLSPPFRGASPWLFGLLAAALTPLGQIAASELVGDRRARVPVVRRLDSLLVVGPVWALAAAFTLN